jgi:hypothetical protein
MVGSSLPGENLDGVGSGDLGMRALYQGGTTSANILLSLTPISSLLE